MGTAEPRSAESGEGVRDDAKKDRPILRSKVQSTKEGEPPIENEAGGIREVICEEAEADTVSRSVRVGIRRSKRWHRRRTKKKEKKSVGALSPDS